MSSLRAKINSLERQLTAATAAAANGDGNGNATRSRSGSIVSGTTGTGGWTKNNSATDEAQVSLLLQELEEVRAIKSEREMTILACKKTLSEAQGEINRLKRELQDTEKMSAAYSDLKKANLKVSSCGSSGSSCGSCGSSDSVEVSRVE
jgi:chromosome segregation ATPase